MPRDEATVLDIIVACRRILDFTRGEDLAAFLADAKTQAAVLHEIQVIGEATKRLSDPFRDSHPTVPWHDIAGMRDKLIHEYDAVDLEVVWKVVASDIPTLLAYLKPLARKP